MRAYEIAVAVAGMVALSAHTRSEGAEKAADVMVYVTGAGLLSGSEDRVVRNAVGGVLARAGVRITWVNSNPKGSGAASSPVVVHIRFVRQSMDAHSAEALAYATPFARGVKTITVLCDQIRMIAGGRAREPHILAHVLAHEIGHVLQGTNRHAESGVMKACWDREDFHAMERNSLEFTLTDVELMRDGLNPMRVRAADLAGGAHER